MTRLAVLISAVVLSTAPSGGGTVSTPSASSEGLDGADLVFTVRHMDGQVEVFGKEISEAQLLFSLSGNVDMIHLALMANGEKNTHVWFPTANLASFSYRYSGIAGKNKLHFRTVQPLEKEAVEPIRARDYK